MEKISRTHLLTLNPVLLSGEEGIPLDFVLPRIDGWRRYRAVDTDPWYQRKLCWSLELNRKYIEAILLGYSTPPLYWNKREYPPSIELVDGKQRLNALVMFVTGKIRIFQSAFPQFPEGILYGDLTQGVQMNTSILYKYTSLQTEEEVVRYYRDLNIGRVAHTKEDLEKVNHFLDTGERPR